FGIGPAELRTEHLAFNVQAGRIVEGTLDAAFVSAGYPAESVALVTRSGGSLLEVGGPAIEHLRSDYPFLRVTLIPGGTYPGPSQPVRTIGVDSLLVCRW